MAEGQRIDGVSVGVIAAGALLAYAGVKGKSIPSLIQGFVQGKSPVSAASANLLGSGATTFGHTTPVSADGSAISADAVKYQGHCYSFGGAPGTDGKGCWDCSSFCNWVIGHDLGMQIPGAAAGSYTGVNHGPATPEWLLWTGAKTIGHDPSVAEAGDICVWQTHMGIALGGGQMISALNPADGTEITTIAGGAPGGEVLFVRRL